MLLSGCAIDSDINEVNCEKKYTYEVASGYSYCEPHETSEITSYIDERIAFLYTYTYEEIEKAIVIMKNGNVYTSDTDIYSYYKNTDWENITPVKTIDYDVMETPHNVANRFSSNCTKNIDFTLM